MVTVSNIEGKGSSTAGTPPSPRYLTILCEFMSFLHQKPQPYPKDHEFSEDELAAITPADICKYMNKKAFNSTTPAPDAKVIGSGSSSLEFIKKALSFYMPHKENWDADRRYGNPTKSTAVKSLLQRVVARGGKARKSIAPVDQHNFLNVAEAAAAAGVTAAANANGHLMAPSDGPCGLLRRMHAQHTDFIQILDTMGSALRTFNRSVDQMKAALETNQIAIRHELTRRNQYDAFKDKKSNDNDGGDAEMKEDGEPITIAEVATTEPLPDIPAIAAVMKEDTARVSETLQDFMDTNVMTNRRVLSGADGFCTFESHHTGKQMDVPEGFDLPSVDLLKAWRHWITGFPEFKIKNDNGEVVDAPIRPLRFINTIDLPQSLKKKFKDGWRPILMSMQGDVGHMLETTPSAAMDEKFVQDTYNVAMSALIERAPAMFENADKCGTWKVATWSRKIREQQLGQQQVRRRQEENDSDGVGGIAMSPIKAETRQRGQQQQHSPPVVHKAGQPQPQLGEQVMHPPSPLVVPLKESTEGPSPAAAEQQPMLGNNADASEGFMRMV